MKTIISTEKFACPIVIDYAYTRFSILPSNIFAKKKKITKLFLPVHTPHPQVESFKQKNG